VCSDLFDSPVGLVCHHHICKAHIPNLLQAEKIICPVCEEPSPGKSLDCFVVNRPLELVVEAWTHQLVAEAKLGSGSVGEAVICGLCDENPATRSCTQCGGALCAECERTHHSKGIFKNHLVVDLDKAQDSKISVDEISKRMLCDDHPDEKLSFYCDDCQQPVCSHCLILGSHKGHNQQPIDQAYNTGKGSLAQWEERLSLHAETAEELLDRLRGIELKVESGAETQRNSINDQLDNLKDIVEMKRQQLLSKSAAEEKDKRVALQGQLDRSEVISRETSTLVDRASRLINIKSMHAFLVLLLPLIQDMQNCARQPMETTVTVHSNFRPLVPDAQVRALGDLDLGRPKVTATVISQAQTAAPQVMPHQVSYSVSQGGGNLSAAPTMAYSVHPQAQSQGIKGQQPQVVQQTVRSGMAPTVVYYCSMPGS